MGNLGATEILIIALVVVLLFGATKLPQMARSLGQSARVFKAETRAMRDDDATTAKQEPSRQEAAGQSASGQSSSEGPQLGSGESGGSRFSSSVEEEHRNNQKS